MTSPTTMRGAYVDSRCGRLHFREIGDGDPIVFVHGGQMDSSFWMRIGPLLAERRRVIAIDLPPYGLSDAPPAEPREFGEFAEPVVALLDALGIERASLAGFHIGASIVTEAAAAYPERVDKLVLLGPFAAETQADRDAAYQALGFDFDDAIVSDPARIVRDFEAKAARPDDADWYTAHLIGRLLAGPRSWWFYRGLFSYDVVSRMRLIESPTLVVHFERDTLPEATARNALQHIQDSVWLMFEDGDPYMPITDPARVAGALSGFLDGR